MLDPRRKKKREAKELKEKQKDELKGRVVVCVHEDLMKDAWWEDGRGKWILKSY